MTDKCPAKYKNLNEIQSFSEQMYPTIQWANQNCQNDAYLKEKTDELEYLTPPAVRKRFCPILIDDVQSWGYQVNSGSLYNENTVTFSNNLEDEFEIDFENLSLIDMDKSDCILETYTDNDVEHKRATVPMEETFTEDFSTSTIDGAGINSFWYVGFDKGKSYQVRPDWLKDELDCEIPAVCRAQTITIAKNSSGNNIQNGWWESVDLQIENNGGTGSNWGSPLYVQIWKTKKKKVEKTQWDRKKKKSVSYNPKQYEYIYVPNDHPKHPLAQCKFQPNKTSPGLYNFKFDKPIRVNTGEHYAIVVLSPLSHYNHCPRWGGWGRNCKRDQKYPGGDAFLSENNGRKWIRYGRNDLKVKYKFGQRTPQDFAFQCHIKEYSSGRKTNEDFYLYLNPIINNPIKKLEITSAICTGNEGSNPNLNLEFQVSSTGQANDWHSLGNNMTQNFTKNNNGEYPHIVFLRAKMSTLSSGVEPSIEYLKIRLTFERPTEMYVRTKFYHPKIDPMLGASVWGRVFAPFETEPSVEGSVEIIQERLVTEHFDIITAEDLDEYTYIEGLDADSLTAEDINERYNYLIDDANALSILKANNVYVKPVTLDNVTHLLSFEEGSGIQFSNSPAYPIQQALLQPIGGEDVSAFAEWVDYKFDYDNDILTFNDVLNTYTEGGAIVTEGVESIPSGTLAVSYNPIFIQDLTSSEVGLREDGEGLILDYFKETFIITDTDLENRYITLRVSPVDPIRKLTINDEEYHEDLDFTVDYDQKQIIFPIISEDNVSTMLNTNDEVVVVYTPNLEDTGISIGYRGKRTNTDKQMIIKPNYIEYKV